MIAKHSVMLFALFIKVMIMAVLIGVADTAAASRPQCSHLAYLSGINYNLLVMDSANQFYTNYSYFCSAQAPEQYACTCGHAETCHKQLDPWGHNIGRCGCCSPGMMAELILIVFVLIMLFILVLYGYFGGRWLDNVWWFQGYPPPVIPVMARHGPYIPIPASEPLPYRLFRGYNTNDFVNEGSDSENNDNDFNNSNSTNSGDNYSTSMRLRDDFEQWLHNFHSRIWPLLPRPEEHPAEQQQEHQEQQEQQQQQQQHLAREELESEEQTIFSVEHEDDLDDLMEDRSVEVDEQNENALSSLEHTRSINNNVIPFMIDATETNTDPMPSNINHSTHNAPFEKSGQIIHSDNYNNNNININNNKNNVNNNTYENDDNDDNNHHHQEQQNNNFVIESNNSNYNNHCNVDHTSKDHISNVQEVPNSNDVERVENVDSTSAVCNISEANTVVLHPDEHHKHRHRRRHHHHDQEYHSPETGNVIVESNKNHHDDDRGKVDSVQHNNKNSANDNSSNKEDANSNYVRSTSFVTVGRSNTSSSVLSLEDVQNDEEPIAEVDYNEI